MNLYNLGSKIEYGTPEYVEWREENRGDRRRGRRFEEYFGVRDRDLGATKGRELLCEAYGIDLDSDHLPHVIEGAFVTDDHGLAGAMIRVIGLDFVYDFKSGLFMFDLFGGHEITMTYLMQAIKQEFIMDFKDGAEQYVTKGYGCFMSSQYPVIYLGEDVAIPQVIQPFKGMIRRM